jgi:hypothetical protein
MTPEHPDVDAALCRLAAALAALGVDGGDPPDASATPEERRAWLAGALLGVAQSEAMRADAERLTRDARYESYDRQLDAAAGDDVVARLELIRWQVRRASGPLPVLARTAGADPIPLAAGQAAEGLQNLLAVAAATHGAVAAGDVDALAAQAAKLRAARTALRASADNTDVLLEMLASVGL